MTFQACSGRIQLSCQVHGAGAGLRSDIPSCLGRGAAALSTFYLRQLGTQACPPPGEVRRGGPPRPNQPELCLRTCIL